MFMFCQLLVWYEMCVFCVCSCVLRGLRNSGNSTICVCVATILAVGVHGFLCVSMCVRDWCVYNLCTCP